MKGREREEEGEGAIWRRKEGRGERGPRGEGKVMLALTRHKCTCVNCLVQPLGHLQLVSDSSFQDLQVNRIFFVLHFGFFQDMSLKSLIAWFLRVGAQSRN